MKTAELRALAAETLRQFKTVSVSASITDDWQMSDIARSLKVDCVYWVVSGQFEMRNWIDVDPDDKTCVRVWDKLWEVV